MRKLWVVVLCGLFLCGLFSTANAAVNLVQNSGFEIWTGTTGANGADFANWRESGDWRVSWDAHSGTFSAQMYAGGAGIPNPDPTSFVSDKINSLGLGTYEFGFWTQMYSQTDPSVLYNGDKAGITFDVYWLGGGASHTYEASTFSSVADWTWNGQMWKTDWLLISGIFDVTAPVLNAELNISLQNWSGAWLDTSIRADDAYLQAVPEPSTMLLLGSGLVGLAGYGRRRFKK